MAGLAGELPRLPAYVAKAAEVADALHRVLAAEVSGARVHPHPPHTQQFQVWMPFPAQRLAAAGLAQVGQTGVAKIGKWREPGRPGPARSEIARETVV